MAFHWWIRTFATISVNRWRGSLLNSPYKDIANFFALIVKAMGMRILYARNNIVDDGGCHTWKNAYLVYLWGYCWGSLQKKSSITYKQIKSYSTHPTSLIFFFYLCIRPKKKFFIVILQGGLHTITCHSLTRLILKFLQY